jgi:hypothetical protein
MNRTILSPLRFVTDFQLFLSSVFQNVCKYTEIPHNSPLFMKKNKKKLSTRLLITIYFIDFVIFINICNFLKKRGGNAHLQSRSLQMACKTQSSPTGLSTSPTFSHPPKGLRHNHIRPSSTTSPAFLPLPLNRRRRRRLIDIVDIDQPTSTMSIWRLRQCRNDGKRKAAAEANEEPLKDFFQRG